MWLVIANEECFLIELLENCYTHIFSQLLRVKLNNKNKRILFLNVRKQALYAKKPIRISQCWGQKHSLTSFYTSHSWVMLPTAQRVCHWHHTYQVCLFICCFIRTASLAVFYLGLKRPFLNWRNQIGEETAGCIWEMMLRTGGCHEPI